MADAAKLAAAPEGLSKYSKRTLVQQKVRLTGTTIDIYRNETDHAFHCDVCEQYSSTDPQALQRHRAKCGKPSASEESSSSSSSSSKRLPPLKMSDFFPLPDENTITKVGDVELLKYTVCLNTLLGVFVCLQCRNVVLPPQSLIPHIRQHLAHLPPLPTDVVNELITTHNLSAQPRLPSQPIPPVYGLDILPQSKIFCSGCDRGYGSNKSLRAHYTNCKHKGCTVYVAYAQQIKTHLIPVKVDQVRRAQDMNFDFMAAYTASITPLRDVENMPLTPSNDEMTYDAYFHREGWVDLLEGHTPAQLADARRSPIDTSAPDPRWPIEAIGPRLKTLSHDFLKNIQDHIRDNSSFGLMNYLGQCQPENLSRVYNFRHILADTVSKYSLPLFRFVFSVIRYYLGVWVDDALDNNTFKYPPLAPCQVAALRELLDVLQQTPYDPQLAFDRFKHALTLLFCHKRTQYPETRKEKRFFSPVCSFLVLHYMKAERCETSVKAVRGALAALMYSVRASILWTCIETDCANSEDSMIDIARGKQVYLKDHHETPMSFMYNAAKVMRHMEEQQVSEADLTWTSPEMDELMYDGKFIPLSALREAVMAQEKLYRDTVADKFFFGLDIPPEFTWTTAISEIVEDSASTRIGYSLVDETRNGAFQEHKAAYGKWLLDNPELRARFTLTDGSSLFWKPQEAQAWLASFEDLCLTLAVGLTLSAGPSPRGSEYSRFLLRNRLGSHRNLRVVASNLSLTSTVDKTSERFNKNLYIPHIPTRRWQRLLLELLCFLRPFAELLVRQLYPVDSDVCEAFYYYLWPARTDEHMCPDRLRAHMLKVTEAVIGVPIGYPLHRTLVTTIFREHAPPLPAKLQLVLYSDRANMHSNTTADKYYSGAIGLPAGASSSEMLKYTAICYWYHKKILEIEDDAIASAASMEPFVVKSAGTSPIDSSTIDSIKALVSELVTAGISKGFTKIEEDIKLIVSRGVSDTMVETATTFWPAPPPSSDPGTLLPVSEIEVHPSRLHDLRVFLQSQTATFKHPHQGALLEYTLRGRENVLAILATGIGKTTMIMMLSRMYASTKTIVVVLPLLSLHANFQRRARQYGLVCEQFNSTLDFNVNAQIVTVPVEALDREHLSKYLSTLHGTKRLYRIFFDEIHCVLTEVHYRDVFSSTMKLNLTGTPIIGLSGTMPPQLVPELSVSVNHHFRVLRMPSHRKEVRLSIVVVENRNNLPSAAVEYFNQVRKQYAPEDRALLYCRTKAEVQQLETLLGVPGYYSGRDEQVLVDFTSGKQVVLPTTTALSYGFHYEHVRDVLHLGLAWSLIHFDQENGRVSRDGKLGRAVTFTTPNPAVVKSNSQFDLGNTELQNWVLTRDAQCLRRIPSEFLDGYPITCTLIPDSVLCDYCESQLKTKAPDAPTRLVPYSKPTFTTPSQPPPGTFKAPYAKGAWQQQPTPHSQAPRSHKVSQPVPQPSPTAHRSQAAPASTSRHPFSDEESSPPGTPALPPPLQPTRPQSTRPQSTRPPPRLTPVPRPMSRYNNKSANPSLPLEIHQPTPSYAGLSKRPGSTGLPSNNALHMTAAPSSSFLPPPKRSRTSNFDAEDMTPTPIIRIPSTHAAAPTTPAFPAASTSDYAYPARHITSTPAPQPPRSPPSSRRYPDPETSNPRMYRFGSPSAEQYIQSLNPDFPGTSVASTSAAAHPQPTNPVASTSAAAQPRAMFPIASMSPSPSPRPMNPGFTYAAAHPQPMNPAFSAPATRQSIHRGPAGFAVNFATQTTPRAGGEQLYDELVNQPLDALFNKLATFCLVCYNTNDHQHRDGVHQHDIHHHDMGDCQSERALRSNNRAYTDFRLSIKSPWGYCFGCLRSVQPWGNHSKQIGHVCPRTQTLHRVAWAYFVLNENRRYGFVPPECIVDQKTYTLWLVDSRQPNPFREGYKFLNIWDLALKYFYAAYPDKVPPPS